jgi:probable F420-dependent oxidoreductase
MELGILYPSTEIEPSARSAREFCRGAEELGYDFIALGDHVLAASRDREVPLWGPYDETDAFHDPFVLTGFMAALTERISFSTNVLILPQRQTALVARQAADAAILSDNRLRLGVGVGWNTVEYEAMGQRFDRRGRRANDQIPLLRRLWREGVITHEGTTERIDRAALMPRPTADIPIWIGGNGDAAFRRATLYADGFMFAGSIANARRGLDRLQAQLAECGRGAGGTFGLELVMIPPAPDRGEKRWPKSRPEFVEGVVATLEAWRELGGTHATVFSTWMGFTAVDEHLAYAERIRGLLPVSAVGPGRQRP